VPSGLRSNYRDWNTGKKVTILFIQASSGTHAATGPFSIKRRVKTNRATGNAKEVLIKRPLTFDTVPKTAVTGIKHAVFMLCRKAMYCCRHTRKAVTLVVVPQRENRSLHVYDQSPEYSCLK
jgi:hypothetical protein